MTGVSGSGKSSLVFDTLYAEGQRRYVETFSPYARQFLDRMDKPQVDRIDGIPPAIAIDQTNPVRTSRSHGRHDDRAQRSSEAAVRARRARFTAGAAARRCGAIRRRRIYADAVDARAAARRPARLIVTFPVEVPKNFTRSRSARTAGAAGLHADPRAARPTRSRWSQDRLRLGSAERARVIEALEAALRVGRGRVDVHARETDRAAGAVVALTRPTCIAPTATSTTATRARACSRSTRRSAPARRAAASAA